MKKPRKYKVFRHFPYIYGVSPCKQVAGMPRIYTFDDAGNSRPVSQIKKDVHSAVLLTDIWARCTL